MEPTKTSVFSVVCWNWAFFAKPYHVQTDGGQYWRELSYWIFFIGSGRHAAFRKYVNGDNRLTQLFFTRMGNLVKMGKSAGGGWLPFWKVLAGKVLTTVHLAMFVNVCILSTGRTRLEPLAIVILSVIMALASVQMIREATEKIIQYTKSDIVNLQFGLVPICICIGTVGRCLCRFVVKPYISKDIFTFSSG